MPHTAVDVRDITKRYRETVALNDVTLSVRRGSVYGLVGPNGAGKTTLLGILSGLRKPSAGTFEVEATRVGVLPDTPRFDSWLTAREVVDLSRTLVAPVVAARSVDAVLEQTGLLSVAHRKVGGFSRGMLQRLGLAAAVVGEPEVLLLDEPAAALDPAGRREVLDMVADLQGASTVVLGLKARGTTVFFSSHILDDVQQVCDAVGILKQGQLVYEGTLDQLVRNAGHEAAYAVRIRGDGTQLVELLESYGWVSRVTIESDVITVTAASGAVLERELVRCLGRADVPIVAVGPVERSLEDVFLEVTQ